MSRDDEAIAAAEVLVLHDEFDSLRRREAEATQALSERAEVRCAAPRAAQSQEDAHLLETSRLCTTFRSAMPG